MAFDLTYADTADRILKVKKSTNHKLARRVVLAALLMLLIASAFGVMYPFPIHGYGPVF